MINLFSRSNNQKITQDAYSQEFWEFITKSFEEKIKPLLHGCIQGNLSVLQEWSQKKPSFFREAVEKGRLLSSAISHGNLEIVDFLLENGANILEADEEGWTPIHLTCFKGNGPIFKKLIARLIPFSEPQTNQGLTPLYLASAKGYIEIVEDLLKRGADPFKPCCRELNPLQIALKNREFGAIEKCIFYKPKQFDEFIRNPSLLFTAIEKEDLAGILFLLEHGADPFQKNEKGWTPLHQAAFEGKETIVKVLIEHQSSLAQQRNSQGLTPLQIAVKNKQFSIIDILHPLSLKSGNWELLSFLEGETATKTKFIQEQWSGDLYPDDGSIRLLGRALAINMITPFYSLCKIVKHIALLGFESLKKIYRIGTFSSNKEPISLSAHFSKIKEDLTFPFEIFFHSLRIIWNRNEGKKSLIEIGEKRGEKGFLYYFGFEKIEKISHLRFIS